MTCRLPGESLLQLIVAVGIAAGRALSAPS